MALRAISSVCTNGPSISQSGTGCRALQPASQFPQLRDGKVEDGYQIASLGRGSFLIGGPGMTGHVPFNPQQNFKHPRTGQLIYKYTQGIASGLTSIIGPLAQAGANIFASQQSISLQRARLQHGGGGFPQQQQQQQQYTPPKSNTGIIVLVVVILVVGGAFMMMQNKN